MMSDEHIDIGDACFIAYIIVNIIHPKEIPEGNLWQKIFVIILDLNAASSDEQKCTRGIKKEKLPVEMVAPFDVNLIRRLALNIPPARI